MRKKILITCFSIPLFLYACSNDSQEDVESQETEATQETEETEETQETQTSEDASDSTEDNELTENQILGEYVYTSDDLSSRVKFEENGTLRFLDNSGNKRYSLRLENKRIIIDDQYYIISENNNGYTLLSIDANSQRTNKDITLERVNQ